MHDLDQIDDDSNGTVFRDVILLALSGFVAIVILLLPHLKPPHPASEAASPPGNVIVEIRWPDDMDADVDLWVEAPGDVPVGYSNKGGVIFNLLRDDLGFIGDVADLNYEVSYSRGVPAGEYTINVHLYRNSARRYPVPVTVVARVKTSPDDSAKRIATTAVDLQREGEEVTAIRFRLDADGRLIRNSVHSLPRALRSRQS